MQVRLIYGVTVSVGICALLGSSIANAPASVQGESPHWVENGCVKSKGSVAAKRLARKAWKKPSGPSQIDKLRFRNLKRCAKTEYQSDVRFPAIWKFYERKFEYHRYVSRLRQACDQAPTSSVKKCIKLASVLHSYPLTILNRIAYCESRYNPWASNGAYYGLFQFHPNTFASTPYGGKDIFSAKWNSLAAAWKMSKHGTGEWACQ